MTISSRSDGSSPRSSGIGFRVEGRRSGWVDVEISFANRALRTLCEDPASSSLAVSTVDALRDRLADVRAADSAADLIVAVTLQPSPPPPRVVIELSDVAAIVFHVGHHRTPVDASGSVRWDRVRRLKIMSVGDWS